MPVKSDLDGGKVPAQSQLMMQTNVKKYIRIGDWSEVLRHRTGSSRSSFHPTSEV